MKVIYLLICSCYSVIGIAKAQVPKTLETITVHVKNHTTQNTDYVRALSILGMVQATKKRGGLAIPENNPGIYSDHVDRYERLQTNSLLIGSVLLLLLVAAVSAWLLNRARVRRLEKAQALRKQIAHDLHDEVSSTLSHISRLSGLVNGLTARNQSDSVERAIQKIDTDGRQILEAMDEIIWTIDPGNDSLHRTAIRLQAYARPLMESKNIRFSLVADPALDVFPISMDVRRNLYLIGKEAINNLINYSEATQATMRFEQQKDQLKVIIEDNGRGFDPARLNSRTGQPSMQDRASAMGAILAVKSTPGQGTLLQLIVYQ